MRLSWHSGDELLTFTEGHGAMTFELWNTRTGNAIGDFATEAEALAYIREAIERHGRAYVDRLLLGCEDVHGRSKPVARGQALADLALGHGAAVATG